MAIIKEKNEIIYRSEDKNSGVSYEVITIQNVYDCSLFKMTITFGDKTRTIMLKNVEFTKHMKRYLIRFYTNLPEDEFITFFESLDVNDVRHFTKVFSSYDKGDSYQSLVDNYGNLLMVLQSYSHYPFGLSTTYRYVAGDIYFEKNLASFCKYLYADLNKYQNFINSLNGKMLDRFFKKSYVVNYLI